jgi:HlyD family secretion protein
MRRSLRTTFIIFGSAVLVCGFGAWKWQTRADSAAALRTAVLRRGDLEATISATGTLEPVEVIDVGAQVAGLIRSFGTDKNGKQIDYGSIIEAGTILAKIDESVYAADFSLAKAQVEQDKAGEMRAAADLDQLKAKAFQAESDWKRAQELGPSEALSRTVYDTYKVNYEIARANVAFGEASILQAKSSTVQAQALLDKAQRNLDFCTIKSPVQGVIIDRRVNIGQTVVASFNAPSLFLIAKDLTRMQIWAAVNEADIGRITPDAPVTFTCDAFPGREFKGAVGKVRFNATMTQNVVMYTVEINTENPDSVLLPYLTANVHFVVRKDTNVLLAPNMALRWQPAAPSEISPDARSWKPDEVQTNTPTGAKSTAERLGLLWVKDGEFVRPIQVKLGVTDGVSTALVSGELKEGQEVVTGHLTQANDTGVKNPFAPTVLRR